ncbi:branched-chain amino acid transport system ATP-binding protein [Roseivivax lentus]|uniref:Branched-chain amino acid transport system ATP-binding protein n=1 Tax=Roseivivax lentus TaxID=633194 RepID=A0A1N7PCE4_9RHOB|nr:ATP-binding cassette domain-containing protein [Roseivivax lentus]SIT08261.1 branched-chain amino acid transport system ATP-binding protein [Roseivivax lentus]
MLDVRNLSVAWRGAAVIDEASFTVNPGEIVVLTGPNGSGKSSLIRALIGLSPVAGGCVRWNRRDVTHRPFHAREGMALVPEGRLLASRLTVEEALLLGAGRGGAVQCASVMQEMFDRFPILETRKDQPAGILSGGEAQMLSLARALMPQPRLLMLDEPTLGLSPVAAKAVVAMLENLRTEGIGMLLTDQHSQAALTLADRAFALFDRRLRPMAPPCPTPEEREIAACSA